MIKNEKLTACWLVREHINKYQAVQQVEIKFFHVYYSVVKSNQNNFRMQFYLKVRYHAKMHSKSDNYQMYAKGTLINWKQKFTWQSEIRQARLARVYQEPTQGHRIHVRTPVGVLTRMFGVGSHYQVNTKSCKCRNLFNVHAPKATQHEAWSCDPWFNGFIGYTWISWHSCVW